MGKTNGNAQRQSPNRSGVRHGGRGTQDFTDDSATGLTRYLRGAVDAVDVLSK